MNLKDKIIFIFLFIVLNVSSVFVMSDQYKYTKIHRWTIVPGFLLRLWINEI